MASEQHSVSRAPSNLKVPFVEFGHPSGPPVSPSAVTVVDDDDSDFDRSSVSNEVSPFGTPPLAQEEDDDILIDLDSARSRALLPNAIVRTASLLDPSVPSSPKQSLARAGKSASAMRSREFGFAREPSGRGSFHEIPLHDTAAADDPKAQRRAPKPEAQHAPAGRFRPFLTVFVVFFVPLVAMSSSLAIPLGTPEPGLTLGNMPYLLAAMPYGCILGATGGVLFYYQVFPLQPSLRLTLRLYLTTLVLAVWATAGQAIIMAAGAFPLPFGLAALVGTGLPLWQIVTSKIWFKIVPPETKDLMAPEQFKETWKWLINFHGYAGSLFVLCTLFLIGFFQSTTSLMQIGCIVLYQAALFPYKFGLQWVLRRLAVAAGHEGRRILDTRNIGMIWAEMASQAFLALMLPRVASVYVFALFLLLEGAMLVMQLVLSSCWFSGVACRLAETRLRPALAARVKEMWATNEAVHEEMLKLFFFNVFVRLATSVAYIVLSLFFFFYSNHRFFKVYELVTVEAYKLSLIYAAASFGFVALQVILSRLVVARLYRKDLVRIGLAQMQCDMLPIAGGVTVAFAFPAIILLQHSNQI